MFAVSSGLVRYLGTWNRFAWYLFLRFKDGREIRQINPSQTLMNLQYSTSALILCTGSDYMASVNTYSFPCTGTMPVYFPVPADWPNYGFAWYNNDKIIINSNYIHYLTLLSKA